MDENKNYEINYTEYIEKLMQVYIISFEILVIILKETLLLFLNQIFYL